MWFTDSCQRGHREAYVIDGADSLAGICILKDEEDGEYGLPSNRLKLCTLKVAEPHRRQRYGALLVKAALDNAVTRGLTGLYVAVFDRHADLIALLLDLGFEIIPSVTPRGELVLWRSLVPPPGAEEQLDGFEFNRRYGPQNLKLEVPVHVVPIEPRWEERLFPEGRVQLGLVPENAACGNDLRKAYLSHSASRQVRRGDIVLFYRFADVRAVRFVAVVEGTLRTRDSAELVSFVGTRTVYTADDIEELTMGGRKDVAAMLIRQSRFPRARLVHWRFGRQRCCRQAAAVHAARPRERSKMGPFDANRVALLSIRPEFAQAIFGGRKTVEFRRSPLSNDITTAVVYATQPIGLVLGWFTIAGISESTPDGLWRRFRSSGAIGRRDYFKYFDGAHRAFAIEIAEVWPLPDPKPLDELVPGLRPPQSFQYLPSAEVWRTLAPSVARPRARLRPVLAL